MKRIFACVALTLSIAAFMCGCNVNKTPRYSPYHTIPTVTPHTTNAPRHLAPYNTTPYAVTPFGAVPEGSRPRVPAARPGPGTTIHPRRNVNPNATTRYSATSPIYPAI